MSSWWSRLFAPVLLAVALTVQGSDAATLYLALLNTADPPRWQPALYDTWQWQLTGTLDLSVDAAIHDIDLFDTPATTVAALHRQGRHVICYISVGSWEDWREDAAAFPPEVLGNDYAGWEGERWLDIRRLDLLGPILQARFDLCQAKGFDAIEPDNIDGYQNATGFPLTEADQLAFNRWLAAEAHRRGLSIGLKNVPDLAPALLDDFDWALTEDCFDQGWCSQMDVFVKAGKPVFAAEYTDTGMTLTRLCPQAAAHGFSAILKDRDLSAPRQVCPAR